MKGFLYVLLSGGGLFYCLCFCMALRRIAGTFLEGMSNWRLGWLSMERLIKLMALTCRAVFSF